MWGASSDYDKLTLEVWTDTTIAARDAVSLGAKILCDHFAVFVAQILCAVFLECFKQYLLFNLYHFAVALIGDIHKRALALNAYYLLYKRSGFCLIVKAHNRGLEFL